MSTAQLHHPQEAICEDREPPKRLFTAADLAAMPSMLPSGPVRFELHSGELVVMPPPSGHDHGSAEARITTVLGWLGDFAGHGKAYCGETGVKLQTDPDTIVGVDAAFLTLEQLPARLSPEGYLLTIPAIVVEVVSKNDTGTDVQKKVDLYLQAGVRRVWVAHPGRRTLTVYESGQEPVILTDADTLTAGDIIPDLAFPVRRLFG